jgi:hypothetical protein
VFDTDQEKEDFNPLQATQDPEVLPCPKVPVLLPVLVAVVPGRLGDRERSLVVSG